MFSWTPFPFVRLAFFFCTGILLGVYLPDWLSIDIAKILFGVLGVLFMLVSYLRSNGKLKALNPGVVGLFVVMLAGYIQVYNSTDYRKPSHFIHEKEIIRNYKAIITKQAQEKKNSW